VCASVAMLHFFPTAFEQIIVQEKLGKSEVLRVSGAAVFVSCCVCGDLIVSVVSTVLLLISKTTLLYHVCRTIRYLLFFCESIMILFSVGD